MTVETNPGKTSVSAPVKPAATPTVDKVAKKTVAAAAELPEESVSLEHFIKDLSGIDRRVELVNAFFKSQQTTGHTIDTMSNFNKRFKAFTTRPV